MRNLRELAGVDKDASELAGVEREQRARKLKASIALPVILTLLNLVFCAWMNPLLWVDIEGYRLTLYLLVQVSVFVFFIMGMFIENVTEILYRVRVFPVNNWSRFLFLVFSNLGSFGFLLYWSSNVFFLAFHYRGSLGVVVTAVSLFTVLTLCIVMIGVVILGRFVGVPKLPRKVILGAAAILTALFAGVFVFRLEFFLYDMPIIAWTVDGIFAAQQGDYFTAFTFFCIMMIILLITLIAGKVNFAGHSRSQR